MDPTLLVMITACALGFLALVGAIREEGAGRRRVVLDDPEPGLVPPAQA